MPNWPAPFDDVIGERNGNLLMLVLILNQCPQPYTSSLGLNARRRLRWNGDQCCDVFVAPIFQRQIILAAVSIVAEFLTKVTGSDGRCPRFQVIERALFQDMHDADILGGMLERRSCWLLNMTDRRCSRASG